MTAATTGGSPEKEGGGPAKTATITPPQRDSEDTAGDRQCIGVGVGRLRATLDAAGTNLSALTVLSPQNDPFRLDTPAHHRNGRWFADAIDRLGIDGPRHLRGLHYVFIGQPKPNGLP